MAASCSLACCREETESESAIIVSLSNGPAKDSSNLEFFTYKNTEENNPRKRKRRIVITESETLTYVGQNFGAEQMKCNNLCKYYVGVLDKQTMQMEVHSAQLFRMQPVIPGEITEEPKSQDVTLSYRDKVDSLIEAFGTNKQKRALSSRRLNQVGSDALHHAVAEAASTVIEHKGLEALQQEVAETESQRAVAIHLPPCNEEADQLEDVYPFDGLLSPVEFSVLEEKGKMFAALTPEELQKMRDEGRNLCVVSHLENLPSEGESREKRARCAFYLSLLIKLLHQRNITRKTWENEGCPRIIQNKLNRLFTVEAFTNGRVQNILSSSMRTKVAAYSLALLLHMGDMTANLSFLHRDLGFTEARVIEIAKSMGLTITKPARIKAAGSAVQEEHRYASLVLPLVKYDKFTERRKRRKMQ